MLLIFQAMDAAGKDGSDQARHVGREPAGLPGRLVQGAVRGGAGSRLSVALPASSCPSAAASASSTARTTKRVLVVRVHPELLAAAEAAAELVGEEHLEGALRGHPRLRAVPRRATASWSASSSCTSRKKEQKKRFLERLDDAGQELEVLARRRSRSAASGTTTWTAYEDMIRHTATERRALVRRAGRQQMVHPPRRGGGASSMRWPRSISAFRKSTRPRRLSSPQRARVLQKE